MRLGGRLAAAIEVLEDIERRRRPAADALKDWGLSHRFAGAGDRSSIGNIVYDALRRKRSAGWLLQDDSPRGVAFGALMLVNGMTAAEINVLLEGDRFAPPPLTGEERARAGSRAAADAPDAVRADVPDWSVPHLEAAFGGEWAAEAEAFAARPPLDLRVNALKASREKVLAELPAALPADLAPFGLRIPPIAGDRRHPNVQVEAAFQKGWFEIQDEGSQLAALLAGAEPGMQVLDFCAGGGGKTLALSADMDNHGQIFAHDADKVRLAPIYERLRRAGSRNVQVIAPAGLDALAGAMDLVLVDAPCTGSGTWRRRPDAKWRLGERQLEARVAEQAAILASAARYVRPGGRLVFITCSVFPEENRRRVEAFLAGHADFAAVDHAALWERRLPGRAGRVRDTSPGLLMTPLRTGTDGFYFAMLAREG